MKTLQYLSDADAYRSTVSEAEFQKMIVEAAERNGWLTYHPFDSRRSALGFPDLTMVRGGELIFAELKTAKGKTSAWQDNWHAKLSMVHKTRAYLWRPSDTDDILHLLTGPSRSSSVPESERPHPATV